MARAPSYQDRLWRLDVITRAVAAQTPQDEAHQAALSRLLGLSTWSLDRHIADSAAAAPAPQSRVRGQDAPNRNDTSAPRPQTAQPEAPLDTPPERVNVYALPAPEHTDGPQWLQVTDPIPMQTAVTAQAEMPLLPQHRARSVLTAALKIAPDARKIDLDTLVRDVAAVRPLRDLPLLPDWRVAAHVTVLRDTSSAMAPFRRDAQTLTHRLTEYFGASRITASTARGWPPEPAPPPFRGAALLVVSGLGLLPADAAEAIARPDDWARFAHTMTRLGWRVVAFTPAAPSDWPASLARAMSLIHWSETTNARQARAAVMGGRPRFASASAQDRDAQAERLAELAALTARLDRPAIRRLRAQVGAGPDLEAQLWWSDDITSRGETGITLSDAARARLQARVRARPDRGALSTALEAHHAQLPAHYAFEQDAIALTVTQPTGWETALRDHLRAGARTVLQGGASARSFALWMLKMLPRLALPASLTEDAAALYYAACKETGAVARREDAPGALRAPAWLSQTLPPSGPSTRVAVTWGTEGLQASPVRHITFQKNSATSLPFSDIASARESPTSVALSPDGHRLAVGYVDGFEFWAEDDGTPRTFEVGHGAISSFAFSRSSDRLYVVSQGTWSSLDISATEDTPHVVATLARNGTSVAEAPDGRQLAAVEPDGDVIIVDLAERVSRTTIASAISDGSVHVLFSRNGKYLAVARDQDLYVYDRRNYGASIHRVFLGADIVALCHAGRDDQMLAGTRDGQVELITLKTGDTGNRYAFDGTAALTCLAAPLGADWAVAGLDDGTVLVFNTETGFEITRLAQDGSINALSIDASGKLMAVTHGELSLYSIAETSAEIPAEPLPSGAPGALIWPDAHHFVPLAPNEDRWLRALPDGLQRRGRTLSTGGPPASLGPARWVDVVAPDDRRYRLEDADIAAARRPLTLGLVLHPNDAERAAPLAEALEERIRAHAGLPENAAVFQRAATQHFIQADRPISRAVTRAEGAAGMVVFGSDALNNKEIFDDLDRMHAMLKTRPPKIEIITHPNDESAMLRLFETISRQYGGDVRWRNVYDTTERDWGIFRDTVFVLHIDEEMSADVRFCQQLERFVRFVQTEDPHHIVIPANLNGGPLSVALFEALPTISKIHIWTASTSSMPDNVNILADEVVERAYALVPAPVLPIQLDTQPPFVDNRTDGWRDWLTVDQLDEAAKWITDAWRRGRLAPTQGAQDEDPVAYGLALCELMQAMTLSMHVEKFSLRLGLRDDTVPMSDFGLTETEPEGDALSPERQRLHHFMYHAEYFHAGPVSEFLKTGKDPWRPRDLEEVITAVEYEFSGLKMEPPDQPSIEFGAVFHSFDQCAPPHERAELLRILGTPELPDRYRWREALDAATVQRINHHGRHRLVRLLHPYTAPAMQDFFNAPCPDKPPVTMVEEVERFQGLFLHYLRGLDTVRPELIAFVDEKRWEEASWLRRGRLGQALKDQLALVHGPAQDAHAVEMPISVFHDIAAVLAEEIAVMVRWRQAQGEALGDVSSVMA